MAQTKAPWSCGRPPRRKSAGAPRRKPPRPAANEDPAAEKEVGRKSDADKEAEKEAGRGAEKNASGAIKTPTPTPCNALT